MPGRNYQSSSSYRYGMNGQEKDDEISGSGNMMTAMFWEYDARLGRRWNTDPKPNPSISSYAVFNNNPIWFNDPLGDSAWTYKNSWNDDYINKFRDFSVKKTEEYKKNGSNFSCEDYAISIAVDFASQNNLPFQFTNEIGIFDPTSDVYTNVDQYKTAVQKFSGANDLANPKNTSEVSMNTAQRGDMILLKQDNTNPKYNHAQVITKTTSSQIDISQGGIYGRLFANSPINILYAGKELSEGSYFKGKNSYFNKTNKEYHQGDFLEENKATIRTWNFNSWNGK